MENILHFYKIVLKCVIFVNIDIFLTYFRFILLQVLVCTSMTTKNEQNNTTSKLANLSADKILTKNENWFCYIDLFYVKKVSRFKPHLPLSIMTHITDHIYIISFYLISQTTFICYLFRILFIIGKKR